MVRINVLNRYGYYAEKKRVLRLWGDYRDRVWETNVAEIKYAA